MELICEDSKWRAAVGFAIPAEFSIISATIRNYFRRVAITTKGRPNRERKVPTFSESIRFDSSNSLILIF